MMLFADTFAVVLEDAKKAGSALIAGHSNPDGDCVGSALALALAFSALGIKPKVLLEPFSPCFDFLAGMEHLHKGGMEVPGEKIMFCVDCATAERLGVFSSLISRVPYIVNIDHHHQEQGYFGRANFVDVTAASTCELVYTLLESADVRITKDIAAALYTGILTDTGGFRHNSATPKTLRIAAALMETGIDFSFIAKKVLHEHTETAARALASAIGSMRIIDEIGLAISALPNESLAALGAVGTDFEGVAEYMLNTSGVEVSALLTEREAGVVSISLRSASLDVRALASRMGGGGHINAAGCRCRGSVDEVLRKVVSAIKEAHGR